MLSDPWFYAVAVPAVVVAGIAKGGFGGGFSFMAVPLMSLVIAPPQAAAIMLPLLCFMDLFGMWAYRRRWDWPNMKIMIPAAMIGICVGTVSFSYLDVATFRLIIGSIAVVFTLNYWFNWSGRERPPAQRSVVKGGFWGAMTGFTSFVAHAGGPPYAMYMLPQRLDKTIYQASSVLFFFSINWVKVIPYFFLGQFNTANVSTSLILAPMVPVGALLGIWMHKNVPEKPFYRVCYFFLFATGVKLLIDGISGYLSF